MWKSHLVKGSSFRHCTRWKPGVQSCNCVDMMYSQGFHYQLSSTSNLHTSDAVPQDLAIAYKRTDEILSAVQPTEVSACTRNNIIRYIQFIAKRTYGIQIYAFGSVPLNTYLPEGDIDLTAVCQLGDEYLVNLFVELLNSEMNSNRGFQVTGITVIPAQVKVVRCCVDNISVDISFNQIAGVCTLDFLDRINEFIGGNHIFRRSLILIKAWCFYESRILGANHGLISTYALETMVLHIINLFHLSLHSPFDVLYKFLQYYSVFNWDMYCLSINGLVIRSSLPEMIVVPAVCSDPLLITDASLHKFRDTYTSYTRVDFHRKEAFRMKYLNVMDPLKVGNNLGVSVNHANFSRIKCALSYGFKTLRDILALPLEDLSKGVDKFFHTIIHNHMNVGRPKIAVSLSDIKLRRDNETRLFGQEGGSCSNAELSATEFPPLQVKPQSEVIPVTQGMNLEEPSAGTFRWGSLRNKDLVISLKSSASASASSPMLKKAEETQIPKPPENQEEVVVAKPASLMETSGFPTFASHGKNSGLQNDLPSSSSSSSSSSRRAKKVEETQSLSPPQIQQDRTVVVKPAPKIDMKEFPSIPNHGQNSGVKKMLASSSAARGKKVIVGTDGRDKGAWNKPLLQTAEKDTAESKGKGLGAWNKPLVWKVATKDQPKGASKEPSVRSPNQKGIDGSKSKGAAPSK